MEEKENAQRKRWFKFSMFLLNDEVSVANYVKNSFLNYISWLARNAARVNEAFPKVCNGHEKTIPVSSKEISANCKEERTLYKFA